ncbi:MAG: hypothetical protein GY898_18335 [Proteobacteria bacterium]|nr:hypothetical protein [Pseudomonadota bacterium]
MLFERWTPTARLTVLEQVSLASEAQTEGWIWGSGTRAPKVTIEQRWLEPDGSAGTPIYRLPKGSDLTRPDVLPLLSYDITSVGQQIAEGERVAIIGVGGDRDILTVLKHGAKTVDAVEINGGIIDVMGDQFAEFSSDPYRLPDGLSLPPGDDDVRRAEQGLVLGRQRSRRRAVQRRGPGARDADRSVRGWPRRGRRLPDRGPGRPALPTPFARVDLQGTHC